MIIWDYKFKKCFRVNKIKQEKVFNKTESFPKYFSIDLLPTYNIPANL